VDIRVRCDARAGTLRSICV